MNNQEIFDRVARHLLTQNAKAIAPDGACSYRAPGGLMCAVGCLIPDSYYDPKLEHNSIGSLESSLASFKKDSKYATSGQKRIGELWDNIRTSLGLDEEGVKLLSSLQAIHDNGGMGYEVSSWPARLRVCAKDYKLSTHVVDNFASLPPA